MTNLVETVITSLTGDMLAKISQAVGTRETEISKGITAAVPALVAGLAGKADQAGGAAALMDMITQGPAIGIPDNLAGYGDSPILAAGESLVKRVLGDSQSVTEAQVAKVSGLSQGMVGRLLPLLMPVVMGALSKEVRSQGLDVASL